MSLGELKRKLARGRNTPTGGLPPVTGARYSSPPSRSTAPEIWVFEAATARDYPGCGKPQEQGAMRRWIWVALLAAAVVIGPASAAFPQ